LLSIDGSITEIPNTISNREHFGYYHNQSDREQARSMVSKNVILNSQFEQNVMFALISKLSSCAKSKALCVRLPTHGVFFVLFCCFLCYN